MSFLEYKTTFKALHCGYALRLDILVNLNEFLESYLLFVINASHSHEDINFDFVMSLCFMF